MEHYEKRIAQLENDQEQLENKADKFKSLNAKLEQRVTSVEHDLQVYSKELHGLEIKHGALKKKMRAWNDGIQILIQQIEKHDSRPDWRPNGE
jgi:chromosome segregation ATPase